MGRPNRTGGQVGVALVMLGIGLAVIAALWWIGHPGLIDRGEGQPRDLWDRHSPWHLGGAAAVAFAGAVLAGRRVGVVVSVLLWIAVEVAQWLPRDGEGGYFEWTDVLWDVVGAVAGAWLGGLL